MNRQLSDMVFEVASNQLCVPQSKLSTESTVRWLKEASQRLAALSKPFSSQCLFFPSASNLLTLLQAIGSATRTLDVCVFTITEDRFAREILSAHRRGVSVRVISDDECMKQQGSDVERMAAAGVPCRIDQDASSHMHHKFAIVDQRVLITGSFNWTRSAHEINRENVLITTEPGAVHGYRDEFERLWTEFAGSDLSGR